MLEVGQVVGALSLPRRCRPRVGCAAWRRGRDSATDDDAQANRPNLATRGAVMIAGVVGLAACSKAGELGCRAGAAASGA